MNYSLIELLIVIQALSQAIDFWCFQKELEIIYIQKQIDESQSQIQKMDQNYKEKLLEKQRTIELLQHQLEQLRNEREKQQKEVAELKEKYAQRSRYTNKLNPSHNAIHCALALYLSSSI
jgi:chromosome segregation ATPase